MSDVQTDNTMTLYHALERIDELQVRCAEALRLLEIADCPCCDKSGAYYDNNGEVCQCQWCDEVNRLRQQADELGRDG